MSAALVRPTLCGLTTAADNRGRILAAQDWFAADDHLMQAAVPTSESQLFTSSLGTTRLAQGNWTPHDYRDDLRTLDLALAGWTTNRIAICTDRLMSAACVPLTSVPIAPRSLELLEVY